MKIIWLSLKEHIQEYENGTIITEQVKKGIWTYSIQNSSVHNISCEVNFQTSYIPMPTL